MFPDVSYPVVPAASAFTRFVKYLFHPSVFASQILIDTYCWFRLTPSKNTNKLSSENSSIRITSTATTISPISRTMTFGKSVGLMSWSL